MKSQYKYLKNSKKRKPSNKKSFFIFQLIFFMILIIIFLSIGIFLFYKKLTSSSSFTMVDDVPQILKNEKIEPSIPEKKTDEKKGAPEVKGENLSRYDFSDWNKNVPLELKIINKSNSLPEGYKPRSLKKLDDNVMVSSDIYAPLIDMINGASKDKVNIRVCSGYRSYERQKHLFDAQVEKEMKSGENCEKCTEKASMVVAKPGQSEHNSGLGVDINSTEDAFKNTDAYKWLSKNAYKYGFIERYKSGKTNHTGVIYEPWHYRFVGKDNAKRIVDSGLCLEEFAFKEMNNNKSYKKS